MTTRGRILAYLIETKKPVSAKEVADALGLRIDLARNHLRRLAKRGVLKVSVEKNHPYRKIYELNGIVTVLGDGAVYCARPYVAFVYKGEVLWIIECEYAEECEGKGWGRRGCILYRNFLNFIRVFVVQERGKTLSPLNL